MAIHIHKNSFNAGEISPLMWERTDDPKHVFGCRIMQNFLPKIYGGAFRRPGTMYIGQARDVAIWRELDSSYTGTSFVFYGKDAPPDSSDGAPFFRVGSIYMQNTRSAYRCTNATEGQAVWQIVTGKTSLNGAVSSNDGVPGVADDSSKGYTIGSVVYNPRTDFLFECSSATAGAAVWDTPVHKFDGWRTSTPGAEDDERQGFSVGSIIVVHDLEWWRCDDDTQGFAVWSQISQQCHFSFDESEPRGLDGSNKGYSVGSYWASPDGRVFVMDDVNGSLPVRLESWSISADTQYVLEFGDGYMRAWNPDGTLLIDKVHSPYSLPLEIKTPYGANDLFQFQMATSGNLAYLAHPDYPPQRLIHFYDASFTAETMEWDEVDWSYPCFRDTNLSDVTVKPTAISSAYINISFTANPFIDTMEYTKYQGAKIQVTQRRENSHASAKLDGSASNSPAVIVRGNYEVTTFGAFEGSLKIQRFNKATNGWQALKTFGFSNEQNRNIVYRGFVEEDTQIRLNVTHSSGSGGIAYLEAEDSRVTGYAELRTLYWSDALPNAQSKVIVPFANEDKTTEWAIESWAEYSGYPRSVAFHEQRLWFGGTRKQPGTIWGSALSDFENFRRGANDDDSIAFTLEGSSAIQSLVSHTSLLIFTQSEEWTASTSEQTAITPSNLFVRAQSNFGSDHKKAFIARNNMMFIQRGGRKILQYEYGREGGKGDATDLTVLSEHITRAGIRDFAFQAQPDPVIWVTRKDGVAVALTYEDEQNVTAWSRHETAQGKFESVASIFGAGDEDDHVWFAVERMGKRTIERFNPLHSLLFNGGEYSSLSYLDSSVVYNGVPSSVITGLDHLEGIEVTVLADGIDVGLHLVTNGEITLVDPASVVVAGLPFTSIVQPTKFELELQDGSAQGRIWRVSRVSVNLYKTAGLLYADSPTAPDDQWFTIDESNGIFTGMKSFVNRGEHRGSVDVTFLTRSPYPCNILAMIPKVDVNGI